ncbi:MAG: hypothetical protein ACRCXN_07515, partial [Bacteroidales bacterium]
YMSNTIITNIHGNSVQKLVEEDGNLYLTFDADLTSFVDQCQRDYNNYDVIARGHSVMEETHRIPEELYWFWRQEASDKGIPQEEVSKYIFNKLNSPDYSKFCVNPKYRKVHK